MAEMKVMYEDELKEVLSHLRNAHLALEYNADGAIPAIEAADNLICKRLFGETHYK